MELPGTVNTFGCVFQLMFVTILLSVIQPMRCFAHPNGKSSMQMFPDMLCGEGSHTPMVVLAFFGTIPLILFTLFYAYIVITIPDKALSDSAVSVWFKFVIYRFLPGTWYWG